MAKKRKIQKRAFTLQNLEVRMDGEGEDKNRTLKGYAAVFDSPSQDLGGFVEVIRKGAFTKTLSESDIRALKNHNDDYVLGRTKSGTLRLKEDDKGLSVEIDLPDTQFANDLYESIDRGDVDQMSFAFRTIRDAWTRREGQLDLRELLEVRVYEVSPVTFPAYEDTEISARGLRALGDDVEEDEEEEDETPEAPPLAGHSEGKDGEGTANRSVEINKRRLQLAMIQ